METKLSTANNMNTPQNDGGAAFPHEAVKWNSDAGIYVKDCENYYPGMTLRDWFAGQALAGIMAYHNPTRGDFHYNCDDKQIANTAYSYADAMLAARNERQEP
jgi:hypothetical protein